MKIWYGGNVDSYRGNEQYSIIEFHGFASWFEGQLDGEVQNGGWTIDNNYTADAVFRREGLII